MLDFIFNFLSPISQVAIVWAVITAVVVAAFVTLSRGGGKQTVSAGIIGLVVGFYAHKLILYWMMPAMCGAWFGYFSQICMTAITAIVIAALSDFFVANRKTGAGFIGLTISIALGIIMVVLTIGQSLFVTLGPANHLAHAKLANVTIASDKETIPPTDANHMVMVTQGMAYFRGQGRIASDGKNLGSIYKTRPEDYTLQGVAGHLYWIAPLVYVNSASTLGIFSDAKWDSPGYIAVDAEDPDGLVALHDEFHIHYLPGAWFSQELIRHAYLNGYMYGYLEAPTLEVDDNWHPYYTITYVKPAFILDSSKISKILLIDATTGDIKSLDQNQVPKWVDRVMSPELIQEYCCNWGLFQDERAANNWFNWTHQYEMRPEEFEMHYNTVDQPVWVVPMTANTNAGSSATGVMVYDTRDNKATFYPGVRGFNVGDNVIETFKHAPMPGNVRSFSVSTPQLYQINGSPTWVTLYTQDHGDSGETFTAIGMVDVNNLNGANVEMAADKRTVLASYANYLASRGSNNMSVAERGVPGKKVSGKVARIGWTLVSGVATYTIQLAGDRRLFVATLKSSDELPVVREGDSVSLTFVDTGAKIEPVMAIIDETLNSPSQK